MGILDFITIILFSAGVLITGISFSRTGKDMKSFFAGGGDVPWAMSGLSLFMGFFSAGTFVVWGSIAYSYGLVAIVIQLTMAVAGFAVGTWIAPRWHRTHNLTAAEYITERFGTNTQKTYTYIFLAVSVFTTGSFLYPVAKIIEVAAGIPLTTSILVLGALSMIYVAVGGLRGVVVTDVLQFVILFAALIIVIPLSFGKIGGVETFFERVPEGFFHLFEGEYTPGFIFAFCIYNMFFLGGNWAYVQRYTSVKTEKDSKKVGWLFGALYLISPVLWMLPPMIYRVFNPGLSGLENEDAYLLMCKEAMPAGMLGLMLGGMIFATASSLNATLNISAGVFTNDIFKRLRPSSSDKTLMKVARISTLCFGVLAVVVALLIKSMGGIVNVVISVAALTGVPIYLPVIWSLFSRRQTSRTILGVTFSSLAINLFFKFVTPWLFGFSLDREWEMMVGAVAPVIMLAVIEIVLWRKGLSDPRYEEYVSVRKQRVVQMTDEEKEAARQTDSFTKKVLGTALAVSGAVIVVLGILSGQDWAAPVIVGALICIVGLSLVIKARKQAVLLAAALSMLPFEDRLNAQDMTDEERIAASQGESSPLLYTVKADEVHLVGPGTFCDGRECTVRAGLGTFFDKLRENREVTVAFIGGSITQGDFCYRQQISRFMEERWPHVRFRWINAGVAGTGTDLGAFRIDSQVLGYDPDLVIMEFAVNGGYAPGMEGMIRKTICHDPSVGICLLYTVKSGQTEIYSRGDVPEGIKTLETLAEYYDIPSVHLGMEAAMLEKEGLLLWAGTEEEAGDRILFSRDGIHPLASGGDIYAAAIARALLKIRETSDGGEYVLPESPMYGSRWDDACMYRPADIAVYDDGWRVAVVADCPYLKKFSGWFDTILTSGEKGSSFSFSFEGDMFGFFDIGGPEAGQLEIVIDGKPVKLEACQDGGFRWWKAGSEGADELNRFNRWCNNRYRGQHDVIGVPFGVHHVTVSISGTDADKRSILPVTSDIDAHPERYAESVIWLGRILLRGMPVGELPVSDRI